MPDKVIRCRFDLNHEVFPSSFYDVRWFRADDRGKLVEITRERFQLRNHPVRRRTTPASRTNRKLAPKALPISEHEIKPRRLAPEAVASGRDQSTELDGSDRASAPAYTGLPRGGGPGCHREDCGAAPSTLGYHGS